MDAAAFQTMMKNSSVRNGEEVEELKGWNTQYPYCQVIHLLLARGTRDLQQPQSEQFLHRAAVYAGDRAVLKTVMTAPAGIRAVAPVIKAAHVEPPVIQEPETPAGPPATVTVTPPATAAGSSVPVNLEGDALRADLDAELHRLHHLMSAFEASYEQLKQPEAPAPTKAPRKPATKSAPIDPVEPPLIEEIKSSKRKPKLVSPKVAEQGEIIDHFIKVAPSLPRTKPTESSADLAAESVNYGDHIVSETLVEILLKQGKKAKAIEMLKKLIWKFPQKKAYFAAQIEALKS